MPKQSIASSIKLYGIIHAFTRMDEAKGKFSVNVPIDLLKKYPREILMLLNDVYYFLNNRSNVKLARKEVAEKLKEFRANLAKNKGSGEDIANTMYTPPDEFKWYDKILKGWIIFEESNMGVGTTKADAVEMFNTSETPSVEGEW